MDKIRWKSIFSVSFVLPLAAQTGPELEFELALTLHYCLVTAPSSYLIDYTLKYKSLSFCRVLEAPTTIGVRIFCKWARYGTTLFLINVQTNGFNIYNRFLCRISLVLGYQLLSYRLTFMPQIWLTQNDNGIMINKRYKESTQRMIVKIVYKQL